MFKFGDKDGPFLTVSGDSVLGGPGVVIVNHDGIPIRSTIADQNLTVQYAGLATQLADRSRTMVRDLDPQVRASPPVLVPAGTGTSFAPHGQLIFCAFSPWTAERS